MCSLNRFVAFITLFAIVQISLQSTGVKLSSATSKRPAWSHWQVVFWRQNDSLQFVFDQYRFVGQKDEKTERHIDKKTMIRTSRTSRRQWNKMNYQDQKMGGVWVGECGARALASRSFDNVNSMTYWSSQMICCFKIEQQCYLHRRWSCFYWCWF